VENRPDRRKDVCRPENMIGRLRLPLLTSYSRRCCSVLLSPPTSGSVILNTVAISDPDLLSSESLLSATITNLNQPKLLSVAIVGQPNVGKSTLFNKLTAHSRAIVTPIPGTTRDRRDGKGHLAGLDLNVIDTGGFDDRGAVTGDIKDQIKRALMQADVVLYVVDGKHGINTIDLNFSQWLRKTLGVIEKYYPKTHSLKREVILVRRLLSLPPDAP
jgi:GTP-binding protein EngB required for normal cell division